MSVLPPVSLHIAHVRHVGASSQGAVDFFGKANPGAWQGSGKEHQAGSRSRAMRGLGRRVGSGICAGTSSRDRRGACVPQGSSFPRRGGNLVRHGGNLVRHGHNLFHRGQNPFRHGKGYFPPQHTLCIAQKMMSATEKVVSATEKVLSVTPKVVSVTDKVKSVPEKVDSMAETTLSARLQGVSEVEKAAFSAEKAAFASKGTTFGALAPASNNPNHTTYRPLWHLQRLPGMAPTPKAIPCAGTHRA